MASRGVNKVIIIGNLGNEPEVRYMPNGTAVANLSIATSETWNDKQTGQAHERTEWHRCEAFGRLAEIIGQYLHKGSKIYVEGSLRTDKWADQSGADRYTTKIRVDTMQMLDNKAGGSSEFAPRSNVGSQPDHASAPAHHNQESFKAPDMPMDDDFGDDIPF